MRINKFISETGFCSRREADKLVKNGQVTINGVKAELGSQVEEGDDVRVNGRKLNEKKSQHVYIALNKPVGITSTTESHIKGNIVDFVGHTERIFPIGRLDKDSEGLILLTSDGDIVNKILRSEGRHEKEYIVTVDRPITNAFIKGMSSGVKILGEMTLPCTITRMSERVFRIILTEGKNRQIRRMCSAFGYSVRRLQRIRIMNIRLGGQKTGTWRDLTEQEKEELGKLLDYKLI
ncbi:23S rRNA pseudouridine(2604) synthase RluF [Paenibacillus faecalis]|uniref:23S rRNA pseudouridine(2604) synthase RluF n=1 Tax=Paenibacillus faecalis TaxID=2079532 RepID=UPI000D0E7533|nr:23S rRNA pseudouridine(2604) synthase RluF [Paenibacillus faecalis]